MFPQEKIEQLITLYEERECLWKKSHVDFKNKTKRDDALKEIGNILSCSESDVYSKIRSLKATFFENLKKSNYSKSGSAACSNKIKWKHYQAMFFLINECGEPGIHDTLEEVNKTLCL